MDQRTLASVLQSRGGSIAEALANVVLGYILAIAVQRLVYPLFGILTTIGEDGLIALIFTVTSLARSYALRRLFNYRDALRDLERQRRDQSLALRLSTGGLAVRARPKEEA